MKARLNLDTDDYLIILLLFVGAIIAAVGIYSVSTLLIDWLKDILTDLSVR